MAQPRIAKSNFKFLKDLAANNDRDWFSENKHRYTEAYENTVGFAEGVLFELRRFDSIETASARKSLYRIYRDVRFAKDKSPYKTYWAGGFSRATEKLRGGYYFQIEPGKTFVAGGFFRPTSADLAHIRRHIADDVGPLNKLLKSRDHSETFGSLNGERVKTAPKGYSRDHPAIELLRYKQFIAKRSFADNAVLAEDFATLVVTTFRSLRPFFDYMSEILTTDIQGAPLL